MNAARRKIEKLKSEIRLQLENDAKKYKRAIIREITFRYEQLKKTRDDVNLEDLSKAVLDKVKVNAGARKEFESDLQKTQNQLAEFHNQYYSKIADETLSLTTKNYEKIIASASVDFPALEADMNEKLKKIFVKSIKSDYSFTNFRSKLLQADLGEAQAYTEANTAVSIFDNAYHKEIALQAGVEKFLWDGRQPIPGISHSICLDNAGKIFTLDELKQMDNGTPLPVETSLGGYNCVHYLTGIVER